MRKVIYDLTYAARGKSGIPKDTRSVAEILEHLDETSVDYVISPKNFVSKYSLRNKFNPMRSSKIVNSIFVPRPNLFSKNPTSYLFRSFFQSLSFQPYIQLERIGFRAASAALKHIGLNEAKHRGNPNVSVMKISYAARFARPKFLGPFRINTKNSDFYIQQQIDPIKVGSSTHHIVRLHDILPITHPFFFSEKAQLAFRRGLANLLSNEKITWVMDTEASKIEFLEIFGNHTKVEVIPCEVGYGLNPLGALASIKNKNKNKNKNIYLCVNTIEPRKNIGMVINSFLSSLSENEKKLKDELVIVGTYGWMEEELIFRLRSGFYGEQITFLEKAQEFQVEELYKSADFVISASEAEGFGLPPLEGMLFGCIPIVSNLPQHHETMGNKAIYFDLNEKSLSIAIAKSRNISIPQRRKLGLEAHSHVRDKYNHDILKKDWERLLQKLKPKEI
jgi:glycosyltransferase involved in cell wall biosynthesis